MVYSNMVLLTVVTTSNPHTLYFDHPIEKPSYIRLLTMSLCNSWYNLQSNAALVYLDLTSNSSVTENINQGRYTLEQLANKIKGAFAAKNVGLKTELHTPRSVMTIHNPKGADIQLSQNMSQLLGIGADLSRVVHVKRLHSPSSYFVHCDLMDKKQNLLNGQAFEKVHYQTPQPHVLRDTDSGDYDVNSITLSVKDEHGNLFNFNNNPFEFELEIN